MVGLWLAEKVSAGQQGRVAAAGNSGGGSGGSGPAATMRRPGGFPDLW